MSKILRRPMFRGGGTVSSYGNGIASGLADGGRVNLQAGGAPYQAGFSAYTPNSNNLTGADIKKMAEDKVFFSGLGKDTAKLNSTMKDLYNNYIQAPLEKGGNRMLDYVLGTEFENKDSNFFDDKDDFRRIYMRDVMPEASKLSSELIAQDTSDDTYDEEFMTDVEVDLRNEQRKKSYIDNAISTDREQAIIDKDYGDLAKLLDKQRREKEESERIRPGGQDAAESDFEIPVGVTEMEGEQEIGFADMAEEYYNLMGAGADERMAERVAAAEAREDKRIKRARGTDISNTLLKVFEGSQQDGATVGSSLVEGSKYLTSKDSATELAKRDKEARMSKLEDAGFNREEARRDAAGQMAFKDMMQDKQFDFSDLKTEKDFERKKEMLIMQLESADNIAEKRIIAARLNTLEQIRNKQFAPGITQKDIEYAAKLPKNSAEYALWLNKNKYAPTLAAQIASRGNDMSSTAMTVGEISATGPIYYNDWGGIYSGQTDDGTYLDVTNKKIITFKGGELVKEEIVSI